MLTCTLTFQSAYERARCVRRAYPHTSCCPISHRQCPRPRIAVRAGTKKAIGCCRPPSAPRRLLAFDDFSGNLACYEHVATARRPGRRHCPHVAVAGPTALSHCCWPREADHHPPKQPSRMLDYSPCHYCEGIGKGLFQTCSPYTQL